MLAGITLGDDIAIVNPSFEDLTGTAPAHFDSSGKLLAGHAAINPIYSFNPSLEYQTSVPAPGWQTSNAAGTLNYSGTPKLTTGATDGQDVAFANGFQNQHGSLSQVLGVNYQFGLTYQLQVDVSSVIGEPVAGYTVSLYSGNIVLASAVDSISITPGLFSTVTISASIYGGSPSIGQPISIVLANSGNAGSGTQVLFDNVKLTTAVSSVPEPSTWMLAAIGVLGLIGVGRRVR